MKKTTKVKIEVDHVEDILCNKCGESCEKSFYDSYVKIHSEFYGLIETRAESGYLSDHLEDGYSYVFSLCEKCLKNMFKRFKIPVEKIRQGAE